MQGSPKRVMVAGATGYVGGRLVPQLLDAGHEVVCLARSPRKLRDREWIDRVEVVRGDATVADDVVAAMDGCDVAYYLLHSMDGEGDFVERERQMARTFRQAAEKADLQRIVYLGGLVAPGHELSEHLASRVAVGDELAAGSVGVTELRAAVIIGSGSASFEMLRNLVEILPVMITPSWADNRCQPIAIRDVLTYLVAAASDTGDSRVREIGGPDVVTYRELMRAYAEVAGLPKRLMIPVPVVTPWLSSHWVGIVTPIPVGLAKPLVQSLVHDTIVTDPSGMADLPAPELDVRTAIRLALGRVQDLEVTTTWASAGSDPVAEPLPEDPDWAGGSLLCDIREITSRTASTEDVWTVVTGIGGARGYYYADLLWQVRGVLDKLVGGIGLRRGRRHPDLLAPGEALDFWRVQEVRPPTDAEPGMLRLRAEMRLPGEAWLEFHISPAGDRTHLEQLARYHPHGLVGRAYWWVLWPFHQLIFPTMARRLMDAAEELAARQTADGGPSQR